MIHRTIELDPDNQTSIRPRRTAEQHRASLAEVQRLARKILSGDYDDRPVSPRQAARYGRVVPMRVALHTQISYDRTFKLGQKRKMPLYRGAEFETFVERRAEMRVANHANNLRRRRAAHTHRTL